MSRLLPIVILFCVSGLIQIAHAQSASELAEGYLSALSDGNYELAGSYFHSDALTEMRESFAFLADLPEEPRTQLYGVIFGQNFDSEKIAALSNEQFYAAIVNFVFMQAKQVGDVTFDSIEVVGEVNEGADVVHVVSRNKVSVGKIQTTEMEVISFTRSNGKLWMQMSGRITGLADQIKAALNVHDG